MSASSDAADQIVRITLDGVQTVAKISGEGAIELAKLLIKEMQMPQRTKGRASLATMLKSQKPIKVFEIDDKSLKKFCEEAKRYGVMYHVLKDKKTGKCDIMVKAEDASKVNRIYERFKLGGCEKGVIRKAVTKSKQTPEKEQPEKSAEEKFIDRLFANPNNKEKTETENPTSAKTAGSRPSEHSSKTTENITPKPGASKQSVKKLIAEINEEKAKAKTSSTKSTKTQSKSKSSKKRSSKNVRS